MHRQIVYGIVVLFIAVAIIGCATIISGRTQSFPVVSHPSGAIVTVGSQKQLTPATFILDKRMDYVVKVEKEGYKTVEITLKKGVSGWVFGNVVFGLIGGGVGVAIDIASGSATKFTPGQLELNLVQQQLSKKGFEDKAVLFVKIDGENRHP